MTSFTAEDLYRHASSMRALARDLLSDTALADDAVQEAWVKALRRPPAPPGSLTSWLGAVVRSCAFDLRRSESRRQRREQLAARTEVCEPIDAAEQLELQHDLVAAVRALPEIYRTVVWLRYFDGRSPTWIAALLGEPVKTIKTRLARALLQLRQRLAGRYGERSAWLPALLPFARLPVRTPGLVAAHAAGALLMLSKNVVGVAIAVVLLVVGALAWPRLMAPPPSSPVPLPIVSSETRTRAEDLPVAADALRRDAVMPAESVALAEPYGALLVQVRWHDGTRAPDVAVMFSVADEPQVDRNEMRVVADAIGIARVERVHAGEVTITSDRGGKVVTEVVAGRVREVEFSLPQGLDVTGVVVDERQRPVADARVFLVSPRGGWLGGRAIAATAADGTFAARAVDPTWSLGALARGYAPSELLDLETFEGAAAGASLHVQLQLLKPGAAVSGTVRDERRVGIAGAVVVLGRGMFGHPEAGRVREAWCPQVTNTDADGNFRLDGVAPGQQQIAARADGFSRAVGVVPCLEGEAASIVLSLAREVVVHGTVRNEAGEAVVGAVVMALDAAPADTPIDFVLSVDLTELKRPQARSNGRGQFWLRGVAPGELQLVAAKRRGMNQ
ncbi:MAG: sigma-70 family RNA polymerase sigma factor, partial [Planctomycetota bacterium]